MKKVLLVVIDALTSRVILPAMDAGRLPHLAALRDHGILRSECSVSFPSITPAATSTIVTGTHPDTHGVAGAYWYDPDQDEVIYYGDDFWALLNYGFDSFFRDFAYKLNHERLTAETLFETVERAGKRAACLNYLIFRGDTRRKLDIPWVMGLIPGVPFSQEICSPFTMYLGTFLSAGFPQMEDDLDLDAPDGFGDHFGMNDRATAEILVRMARKRSLPDFTLAYFPDNDFLSHEVGPDQALEAVELVDETLGQLFDAFGGMERMLDEFCILIVGDHSQSDLIDDRAEAGIMLTDLLGDLNLADAGESWSGDDQLVACPDMRVVHIYLRQLQLERHKQVVAHLLDDPRIDQVMWRADLFSDQQQRQGCYVMTRDRGSLFFQQGRSGPSTAVDRYGGSWIWEGDLRAVDGQLQDAGNIVFPTYPNAFERIAGGLYCENSGHIWATAHPGHEFLLPNTSIHACGSHGTLHALDSITSLFVAGAPADIEVPTHPRTLDVAPLCLAVLGLTPHHAVGHSRFGNAP